MGLQYSTSSTPTGPAAAVICVFDQIELDGEDLRREPSETRKSTLKPLLRGNGRFGPESSGVAKRATRLGDEFRR
jgi:ATP-dependent DNA ligase